MFDLVTATQIAPTGFPLIPTYNNSTNVLSIPYILGSDGNHYSVEMLNTGNYVFSLTSLNNAAPADTYDLGAGEISIQDVSALGSHYRVTLSNAGLDAHGNHIFILATATQIAPTGFPSIPTYNDSTNVLSIPYILGSDGNHYSVEMLNTGNYVFSLTSITQVTDPPPNVLSLDEIEYLDSLTPQSVDKTNVILPNGTSLAQFVLQNKASIIPEASPLDSTQTLAKLISDMLARAIQLTEPVNYAEDCCTPNVRGPAQSKLAYSFGSKDETIRQRPPAGLCTTAVYGLDCSGLVYLAANAAGIKLPIVEAAKMANPYIWNNAIPKDWSIAYKKVDAGSLLPGDIVVWAKGHVGISAGAGTNPGIIQSSGTSGIGLSGNILTTACTRNYPTNINENR